MKAPRSRRFWGLVAAAAVLIVALANAHLVLVATTTDPGCVTHVKAGDADRPVGTFRAAQSSC